LQRRESSSPPRPFARLSTAGTNNRKRERKRERKKGDKEANSMGYGRKEGKSMEGEGEAGRPYLKHAPTCLPRRYPLWRHLDPVSSNPNVGVLFDSIHVHPPTPHPPKGRVGHCEGRLLKRNMKRERSDGSPAHLHGRSADRHRPWLTTERG
jgi:hypothetical protein